MKIFSVKLYYFSLQDRLINNTNSKYQYYRKVTAKTVVKILIEGALFTFEQNAMLILFISLSCEITTNNSLIYCNYLIFLSDIHDT